MTSEAPLVQVLEGPRPGDDGCVHFVLRVGEVSFDAFLDWSYRNGAPPPEELSLDVTNPARLFLEHFSSTSIVLTHRLLKRARELAPPACLPPPGTLLRPPHPASEDLHFDVTVGTASIGIDISPSLAPRHGRLASGEFPDEDSYWQAYEAALEYMVSHLEELESLGFDTTYLKEQMRDARTFPGCEDIPDPAT